MLQVLLQNRFLDSNEAAQRGVQATKQIIEMLVDGVGFAEGVPMFVVEMLHSKFLVTTNNQDPHTTKGFLVCRNFASAVESSNMFPTAKVTGTWNGRRQRGSCRTSS